MLATFTPSVLNQLELEVLTPTYLKNWGNKLILVRWYSIESRLKVFVEKAGLRNVVYGCAAVTTMYKFMVRLR